MRILVTGGAGFIGSAVIRHLLNVTDWQIVNCDKLTYAGNLESLDAASGSPRYAFELADICDAVRMQAIFEKYRPAFVLHLAAESHVDRSIDGPAAFIETNIVGTYSLLESARRYWEQLPETERAIFRFHHVSTDEVFGSLDSTGFFVETTPYDPRSPYAASKAASDHLVRAWGHTFGLPIIVTNCSNNFGPYQYPEKLIPLIIHRALAGQPLPVYGTGENVRDWLYVDDHARALHLVLTQGKIGETYNIGGGNEQRNIDVVHALCGILDELAPRLAGSYAELITYVPDRPGHDLRYAIDAAKIRRELNWRPRETFSSGLRKTVEWYLANAGWCERAMAGRYSGERLGAQNGQKNNS